MGTPQISGAVRVQNEPQNMKQHVHGPLTQTARSPDIHGHPQHTWTPPNFRAGKRAQKSQKNKVMCTRPTDADSYPAYRAWEDMWPLRNMWSKSDGVAVHSRPKSHVGARVHRPPDIHGCPQNTWPLTQFSGMGNFRK